MRKQILLAIAILVIGLSALAYKLYEQHVSPGVRQALTSATESVSVSPDIDRAYLHDAMIQIRTQKDAELVGLLDNAIKSADEWRQLQYDTGYDSANATTPTQLEVAKHDREKASQSLTNATTSFIRLRRELGLPPGDFASLK